YGLTCDSLLEATVVDGNGLIHSTKKNPDLLWAIRGGGTGSFAIATELVFQTYSAPAQMQVYQLKARKLNVSRTKSILRKWFTFCEQIPLSSFSAYILNGHTLTVLVTGFEGCADDLQRSIREFALCMDECRANPPAELAVTLKRYYGSPVSLYFKNSSAGFYRGFKDIEPCIDQVIEKSMHTQGIIYQINTLGGNISNFAFEEASCYPHRRFNFISELQAYWQKPSQEEKLIAVTKEIQSVFRLHGISSHYVNYGSLDFDDWQNAYYGKNYSKLQAIKKKYDPDNRLRHPQSINA